MSAEPGHGIDPGSTTRMSYAAALRAVGLRVTSARIATLRAVPEVLKEHGYLTPSLLHAACLRLGYSVHPNSFALLLSSLSAAGLIAAPARRLPAGAKAGRAAEEQAGA